VIQALKQEKIALSVDTYKPEVMRQALKMGVDMINDITALKDPASIEILKQYHVPVVIMYNRGPGPHADRNPRGHSGLMDEILKFFEERIKTLTGAGIRLENIIIDPGMGFFLSAIPEASLAVLKHLRELKSLGARLYLSTSRKSFIGTVLNREITKRAAGTLATELWAYLQGVDFIRTHEVAPLRDALRMLKAIQTID
jgi:dihydropteroate synthase